MKFRKKSGKKPVYTKDKKLNQTRKRANVVKVILALFVMLSIFQLFRLQILEGAELRSEAMKGRRSVEVIPAKRGAILDRNEEVLVMSYDSSNLYANITYQKNIDPEQIRKVANAIHSEPAAVEKTIEKKKQHLSEKNPSNQILLKKRLTGDEISSIQLLGFPWLKLKTEKERYYPKETQMSHLLGNWEIGYGLEAYYDDVLKGIPGLKSISLDHRDASVVATEPEESFKPENGHSIVLTVDKEISGMVADVLQEAYQTYRPKMMTAIVMDPNTGEVISMESIPNFNPNEPRTPILDIDRANWDSLSEAQKKAIWLERWKNPAISFTYEPGSVFKTLTTAIALENHTSKPSSRYVCTGSIEIAKNTVIHCWSSTPHGVQTLKEALGNSCNPAFVQIVREIGKERFVQTLEALRFGQKTGIDLPGEETGLLVSDPDELPDPQFQTMSYGHGVSATPIQVLTACNTVINGGYYRRPYLLKSIVDDNKVIISKEDPETKQQLFSEETSNTMREYLAYTVNDATSSQARSSRVTVGGKSGTTLKIKADGTYSDEDTVASFFAFFPADRPKYSILVVANSPSTASGGNTVSGSTAKKIIEGILDLKPEILHPQENE